MPRRRRLPPLAALLALAALAGCGSLALVEDGAQPGSGARGALPRLGGVPAPGTRTARVPPLADRRGVHPGLTPVPDGERAAARRLVEGVRVRGRGAMTGYEREAFGEAWTDDTAAPWGRDGCRTREEVLHRDLRAPTFRAGTDGCVVLDGLLSDPYTGRLIAFSKARPTEVQIDHVIPLAMAWRQGADRWTAARREQLANDPLELLAVDGGENQSKGDSGPASWLPPRRAVRCAYAVRVAQVARRYDLPVPAADRAAMVRQCS